VGASGVVLLSDGVGVAVSVVLSVGVGVGQSVPVGLGDGVALVVVLAVGLAVSDALVLDVGDGVEHGASVAVAELEPGVFGVVRVRLGDGDFVGGFGFGFGFLGGTPSGGPGLTGGKFTCGGDGVGSVGTTGTVSPGTPLA
jgi:hypothetical protein